MSSKLAMSDGLGVTSIDHALPSHNSASVSGKLCSALVVVSPTAVQASAEVHETASRSLPLPVWLGVGTIDHCVPSHASASVAMEAADSPVKPTAMQAVSDVHEMPSSSLKLPVGLGADSIDHWVPSHVSTSVEYAPTAEGADQPTATHSADDTQETSSNSPS